MGILWRFRVFFEVRLGVLRVSVGWGGGWGVVFRGGLFRVRVWFVGD